MDAKTILSEVLGYYKHKVDNNLCTMEEMESVTKLLEGNMKVYGTAEDLAKFFGVSEHSVRNTINRKLIAKPKRRVYYPFLPFLKIAPRKWREKT